MSELPERFLQLKRECLEIVAPIKPADKSTLAERNFLFSARRTDAGRKLPPPYLVYFLFVDLLGFKNLGQWEKIAFSIPIDFNGRAFLIDHRKMGLGVFAQNLERDEPEAAKIVTLVNKASVHSVPYFDWLAEEAQSQSKLNVRNQAMQLFERYEFFVELYHSTINQASDFRESAKEAKRLKTRSKRSSRAWQLERQANWVAVAAIDAFFSWTEHVFILVGILLGKLATGDEVAKIANSNWNAKFKVALDVSNPETKRFYDRLYDIRRQLRNYIAHGAFGKNGEAFSIHSAAGAVPLLLPESITGKPRLGGSLSFQEAPTLAMLAEFIDHLWSGERAPAKLYCQEYAIPLILTLVSDGSYEKAMGSVGEMNTFLDQLGAIFDRSADMEW